MITFKQFLTEAQSPRTREISVEEAVELVNDHCSVWARKFGQGGVYIYRGVDSRNVQALFGDSTKGEERTSANTSNYFTLWHDNSPDWADYPKRGRSFICSTSKGYTEHYGWSYLVIPYDNAILAVLPEGDLFGSFDLGGKDYQGADLSEFNDSLSQVFKLLKIEKPQTYEQLAKSIKSITLEKLSAENQRLDQEDAGGGLSGESVSYFVHMLETHRAQNLFDLFKAVFTPSKTKRFTASNGKLSKTLDGNEVYIQGKAVMIRMADIEKFHELSQKFGWDFGDE